MSRETNCSEVTGPRPVAAVAAAGGAYSPSSPPTPIDLKLDGNEGAAPPARLLRELADLGPEMLRRYPDARALEAALARRFGLQPDQVVVTAGADEALDRIARTFLAPDLAHRRRVVLPVPTFEMLEKYLRLVDADVDEVEWRDGPFPIDDVLARVNDGTAAIAVVSPNNPTGAVATGSDLRRLALAAPNALLVVDLAYAEFADEDLTRTALELRNALVVRTFSKAYGLAGLRVGYVLGRADLVSWLRAGSPFPVSGPSLALAARRLELANTDDDGVGASIARVRDERDSIARALVQYGAAASPSQANFVLGRFKDALFVRDALAGLGIAVRAWPKRARLADALRITCPADAQASERLRGALATVLAPQALLFDLDGVLADVSGSYRAAIVATAQSFGVELAREEIAAAKAAGGANDDWSLTQRLLAARGVIAPLEAVTARFEEIYQGREYAPGQGREYAPGQGREYAPGQGRADAPGLRTRETLRIDRDALAGFARRLPLAIVTGRPRSDALRFLDEQQISGAFHAVVAREDAPLKPDPRPVRLALERLGVTRAWMIGDTVDDVRAARAASVVPLGVVAPGDDAKSASAALLAAGAGRVLTSLEELLEQIP